jgi:hypothetical protein
MNSLLGVGLDGNRFVFVRFRDGKWQVQDPVEVNQYSAQRFLWSLFNLGTKGKPFSSEYLAKDFGSEAELAQTGIRALYEAILVTDSIKARTFFEEWNLLFSEVSGYDSNNPTNKIRHLAESYGVSADSVQPAPLLFALQTYYALFMKLLASEIVAFFHQLETPVQKVMGAETGNEVRHEMEDLEAGGVFKHLNVTNFLEGDLFAWYTDAWSKPIEDLIRKMAARLDDYNPGTLSEDPAGNQDLLKELYYHLFPRSVRHDLGEYYTPDWLAEHVLNEVGYVGDPDKSLLDPSCGSGTFLVMAINRIRAWYDENRERCGFDEGGLRHKILSNVTGFDLNPIAVMAARTNYLIAVRDLIGDVDSVEIPVYLCDSVMTPSEYGELFAGGLGTAKELKTAATTFVIPTEIATNREDVAKYAEQLEYCVQNGCSATEFIERCRNEELSVSEESLHRQLYGELLGLEEANRNGVWARIIKNAFAPLFTPRVDYVVGNPPWIFWNNLPAEYREKVRSLMADVYAIAAQKASTMKQLGAAGKDLSMLFVYVSIDKYLKDGGKLGFVITQTIFQTTAGNEFRRFKLPSGRPFKVEKVEDWVKVQPFLPKAGNKTAVIIADRGGATQYPVPYTTFTPLGSFDRQKADLSEVMEKSASIDEFAHLSNPSNPMSFWVIGSSRTADVSRASTGDYEGRRGIETGLESAFRVQVLRRITDNTVLIRNDTARAKIELPKRTTAVEDSLILPYVSGASLARWKFVPAGYYLVPHTKQTGMSPISVSEMRSRYPKTLDFFRHFEHKLETRPIHLRWGKNNPFYSMYNVGPYTFASYHVAWKRTTKNFACTVLGTINDPMLGERLVVPNGKVMIVPFNDPYAAHYLCAVLNSSPARIRINRSITSEAHKDIIKVVPLESYSSSLDGHRALAELSKRLHKAAAQNEETTVTDLEAELDERVAEMWEISAGELKSIQNALA